MSIPALEKCTVKTFSQHLSDACGVIDNTLRLTEPEEAFS